MRKIFYFLIVCGALFLSSSVMAASGDLCGKIGGNCLYILSKDNAEFAVFIDDVTRYNASKEGWEKDFSRCIQDYKNLECSMEKLKDIYNLAQWINKVDYDVLAELNKVYGKKIESKDGAAAVYMNYVDNVRNLDPSNALAAIERCEKDSFTFFRKFCEAAKDVKIDNEKILYTIKFIKKKKELIMSKQY
ncbi:MAG: hypothetical protein V8R89_09840 [Alphaproteobacteria bacterium]|nr:MAG TPA: hypothetical protein [Caudoviricetes sp.]